DKSMVGGAWNRGRMRYGDTINVEPPDGARALHPNQFLASSVLTSAWKQVGKNKTMRSGVDGTRGRELAILSASASLISMRQDRFIEDRTESIQGPPVWSIFYDATPIRLKFGNIQDMVAPIARYPVQDKESKEWRLVTYSEYRRLMPRRPEPRFGVLEVFVQGLTCHYLTTDGVLEGFRSYCMPKALESNNCSVLLKATESSTPTFSRDKLRPLAAVHKYSLVAE
ncbi:unnamed protein product, partial [Prorocentrum cordatum]